MDKYEGRIDEFTDWVSGEHEVKGTNVTGGLPVSLGAIRDLLMRKLKEPFLFIEDKAAGLYRMFSSEESYRLWNEDPETNSELELFNFVRPSDYELTCDISSDPRYIISGDSTQTASKLIYHWAVRNDSGEYADSITVTYTITDSSGSETSKSEIYGSAQKNVQFDLYDYLKEGQNTVNVSLRSNNTGAAFAQTFIITVLRLELTCEFDYNAKHQPSTENGYLQVPFTLKRNDTSHACSVYLYIDGTQVSKVDVPINSTTEYTTSVTVPNIYDGSDALHRNVVHTLQLCAKMLINNSEFQSSILYYTFETASADAIVNYFVNVRHSFNNVVPPVSDFVLYATQYMGFTLNWGYYTDQLQNNTSIPVTWKLESGGNSTTLATITANKGKESDSLTFIPSIYNVATGQASTTEDIYLVAYFGQQEIARFPMRIAQSSLNVYETPGYDFKLTAYGKTNSAENTQWKDTVHAAEVAFTGIRWDSNSGWYNDSFRVSGTGSYAVVDYKPLANNPSNGRTIEVEFESEKTVSESDVLIRFGDTTGAHLDIMPSKAVLYDNGGAQRIYTNYKSNERRKLAFIINEENNDADSRLLFIVNNGILERGASGAYNFANTNGKITIGGSTSGVRVYSMRVYNRAITYADAYNNYAYDSEDKSAVINRNNVIDQSSQQINYDLCCNKLDTILITGDLTEILDSENDKDESTTNVTIERFSPFDTSKNFVCEGCQARKHGQSTLNYPISSIKVWFNKRAGSSEVPTFTCEGQRNLGLAKNRYVMKDGCTPANKFVLQANYADSSGVHNGGIERMIQQTWYDAVIDDEYKLRTIPQLFASSQTVNHNNQDLHETGNRDGVNGDGKQWNTYFGNKPFPHKVEVAPDSYPCVVFYCNTAGDNRNTYLGQYVFMEDKKSDFNFGERSIYKAAASDPYCLTIERKNDDTAANRIWNNNNVLRMEVLNINTLFSSYMSLTDPLGVDFEAVVYDNQTNLPVQYRFEQDFELIYPDPDDIEGDAALGTDKFGANSKFLATVQPFINWYKWLVSTYQDQQKFEQEAAQHLDLYKLAAYYIFMLRLGLVDSCERNAQIKTYDGVHFHYEPWDMDIALGNKNTGGIAFDPPIDRNTTLPTDATTYAFSGRSTTTSNWLWDALEAWDEWINRIVPKVAQALYTAGLSYDNITRMFDEEYANRWCEILYNESGYFKYVLSRGSQDHWLDWLQGARTSHRHWWLSTSMDYYDAKWGVGDYKNHFLYIAANHDRKQGQAGQDVITITPTSATFFSFVASDNNTTEIGPVYATPTSPAAMDITTLGFSNKTPRHIYGALFIENLDISCLASRLNILRLGSSYSKVLGAPLKSLNVGVPFTQGVDVNHYTGGINGFNIALDTISTSGDDAFENLQTLNMRGQRENAFNLYQNIRVLNRSQLRDFYAMGSTFSAFYSSRDGNTFGTIELPGWMRDSDNNTVSSFTTLDLHNTTWETLTFFDGIITLGGQQEGEGIDSETVTANTVECVRCSVNSNYSLDIPHTLTSVTFTGSTCEHANSLAFVKKWISCIVAREGEAGLASKTLILNGINWTEETCGAANLPTYNDMRLLSMFNGGHNRVEDNTYKGYIVLNSSQGQLTSNQLTQMKAWFGDPIFSRNSSGLIIDQKLNYIQINVGSDAYIENGNIYLDEGTRAYLSATKFALSENDDQQFLWGLRAPNSSGSTSAVYNSASLEQYEGVWMIKAQESSYGNYAVQVLCSSVSGASSVGNVTINVRGVTYPSSLSIAKMRTADSAYDARGTGNSFSLWSQGIVSEFYLVLPTAYTEAANKASIKRVTFTLTNNSTGVKLLDNVPSTEFHTDETGFTALDDYLQYRRRSTYDYGLTLASASVPETGTVSYTLKMKVTYGSNREDTVQCTITVLDDGVYVISSLSGILYDVISAKYYSLFGSYPENNLYYRSDLERLTGTLSFYNKTTLTSLRGENGQSILKYLTNVTELNLSTCTTLLSTDNGIQGDDKRTLVFDGMPNLEVLNVNMCSKLNVDIDLSTCTKIRQVAAQTNSSSNHVSVLMPSGTVATTYQVGYPVTVSLVNPTVLTVNGVSTQGSSYIERVELVNIPNGAGFAMLKKIMKW